MIHQPFLHFPRPRWAAPMVCLLLCAWLNGCVNAVRPYNSPSQQKVQLQSASPQEYIITVAEQRDYPVPADGRLVLDVPRLERGCATYLFGKIKVKDSSPYDVPAIVLKRAGRTVERFSLNDMAKLPLDAEGYHLIKAD